MFTRLIALFPCQSLEDFDLERQEADAEQLLSAWSALWHPALLADAGTIPSWLPAASPPSDASGHLIVVPDCCEASLPIGWPAEAEATGACLFRGLQHRHQIVAATLERLGDRNRLPLDPDLTADFLALGHCHLQVELLTRKLRYMSNLDEQGLQTAALAAAAEAVAGDAAAARRHLQSAFDRLHEAREYFYPLEARLLDLTLVAPSTLGQALRDELSHRSPCNLLASGEIIEELGRREPETLSLLRQALSAGSVSLVGGELMEAPLPLLDPEAIAQHLSRGLEVYQKYLQQRPLIFGRRRFGLTPLLPQVLGRLGFAAAVHCTLDDGRFPTGDENLIPWEGLDGTTIPSLACVPIDAGRAESFLALPKRLADTMSLDRTAAVVFAHWPGRSSCWYDDLRRMAAYGAVLGSFSTITALLDDARPAGEAKHYQPDEYRSPYLAQEVATGHPDPISRWVRYFCRRSKWEASAALDALAKLCRGHGASAMRQAREKGEKHPFDCRIEDAQDVNPDFDGELETILQESLADFACCLIGPATSSRRGTLLVNPLSFSQEPPSSLSPLLSPLSPLPSMGFCWIAADASAAPPPVEHKGWLGRRGQKPPPPVAEENLLRNEFCEIRFDPTTGAIRSISDYQHRDPRLAQQIALRLPHSGQPGADANYSIMAADRIEVTSSGPTLGEIVSRGRLLDREGRRMAGFRQTTRLQRGSRVIELLIELDIDRQPGEKPWESYYAARFAWKDEGSALRRGVGLANMPTDLTHIESPHFLDICSGAQRTTLLCGGLPYHRRLGLRKLDSILVVHGERARSFRLGIGIDVPNSAAAALGFLAPSLALADQPPPPSPAGWLFHLDRRNVLATHWEASLPIATNDSTEENSRGPTARGEPATESARPTAFRVRLLETDGRGVTFGLRCFRPVLSAEKINAGDVPPVPLVVEGDRIDIPIGPHQWIEVEVVLS